MKLKFSLFANKIVNEELELIQKALVIAHHHYVSLGNFDDALNITKLLFENQDEAGCFIFSNINENLINYLAPHIMATKSQAGNGANLDELPVNMCRGW